MLTNEELIKLRLYESIAKNAEKLIDKNHYYSPTNIAYQTNEVYNILFNNPKN